MRTDTVLFCGSLKHATKSKTKQRQNQHQEVEEPHKQKARKLTNRFCKIVARNKKIKVTITEENYLR